MCKAHGKKISIVIEKIKASPTFPTCRVYPLNSAFRGEPSNTDVPIEHVICGLNPGLGSWVEGLTMREVSCISHASPRRIASALRKE